MLCGWLGTGHVFWCLLDGYGVGHASLLMLPCLVNVEAAALFSAVTNTRFTAAPPARLVRLLTSFGMTYGTAACIEVIIGRGLWNRLPEDASSQSTIVMLGFALICAAITASAFWTGLKQKDRMQVPTRKPDGGYAARTGIDEQPLYGSPVGKVGTGQRLSVDFSNGPIANVQRSVGDFGDAATQVRSDHTLNLRCEPQCGHCAASDLSVSIASFQCTAGRPIFIALVSRDR